MKRLFDWLDHRTGVKALLQHALYESVPGGARWRYVWGSTLTFCLAVQFITGLFLWMAYSPSSQTAWESVYYIQHEMWGGWLLRGLHHYTAQVMTVLLVLHFMQVLIDGAYKAPRELNFWIGLGLLLLVLGLSLTGYLLPWDQKGYWATKVATNIAAITPVIGPSLQKIIVGGTDYGHHTLTRFFALHAGVIPGTIVLLLVGHIYLFRRHGLTVRTPQRAADTTFWPDQVLKDAVACLAVLGAVLFLVLRARGAELGAPADPAESFDARPEWYFLFLFQFLKYFEGGTEIWGAIVIPTLLLLVVCAMPILGRWRLGHRFNVGFAWSIMAGLALLTWLALAGDRRNPEYQAGARQAEKEARRVVELAQSPRGIPAEGAVALLRDDPLTQGPKLFARNCASCHRHGGEDGLGRMPTETYTVLTNETLADLARTFAMTESGIMTRNRLPSATLTNGQTLTVHARQTAPDLKGFASRAWLAGLLDPAHVAGSNYFGGTKFKEGKMVKFVKKDVAGFSAPEKEQLAKVVAALSAEAGLPSQRELDLRDAALVAEGRKLVAHDTMRCSECHQFHQKDEDATAPDLTGYGSRDWLIAVISNPKHERFYGKRNDRMPAFGEDGVLDRQAIGLLADWLRGDWYEAPRSEPGSATTARR